MEANRSRLTLTPKARIDRNPIASQFNNVTPLFVRKDQFVDPKVQFGQEAKREVTRDDLLAGLRQVHKVIDHALTVLVADSVLIEALRKRGDTSGLLVVPFDHLQCLEDERVQCGLRKRIDSVRARYVDDAAEAVIEKFAGIREASTNNGKPRVIGNVRVIDDLTSERRADVLCLNDLEREVVAVERVGDRQRDEGNEGNLVNLFDL